MKPFAYTHFFNLIGVNSPPLCGEILKPCTVGFYPTSKSVSIPRLLAAGFFIGFLCSIAYTSLSLIAHPALADSVSRDLGNVLSPQEEEFWRNKMPHTDVESLSGRISMTQGVYLRTFVEGQFVGCQRNAREDSHSQKEKQDILRMCEILRDRTLQRLSEANTIAPENVRTIEKDNISIIPQQKGAVATQEEILTGHQNYVLYDFVISQYLMCQKSVKDYLPDMHESDFLPLCDLLRDRTIQKISEIQPPSLQEIRAAQLKMLR